MPAPAPRGQLHPGADDNASGVAVMLELARLMADAKPDRSIIFAAFAGEEAGLLGSRHYVRMAGAPGAPYALSGHIADLNLDTVGHLADGKVTIFGAGSARELPFIFMGAGAVTGVPVQTVTQDVNASDHAAFVEAGVPAVQLFASSGGNYHRPSDTPDKIDDAGLGKVAAVLKEAVDYLAARPEPLHFSGAAVAAAPPRGPAAGSPGLGAAARDPPGRHRHRAGHDPPGRRRARRQRAAGFGAETAGIKPGDRLLALGGVKTSDLRALANALRDLSPGQVVAVEFARDTAILSGTLRLGER